MTRPDQVPIEKMIETAGIELETSLKLNHSALLDNKLVPVLFFGLPSVSLHIDCVAHPRRLLRSSTPVQWSHHDLGGIVVVVVVSVGVVS